MPRYNFQSITSKGAIVLLIVDCLMQFFQSFMAFAVIFYLNFMGGINQNTLLLETTRYIRYVALILYPIGGLVADMWTGRYRMIVFSMVLCFIGWILLVILTMVMWFCGENKIMVNLLLAILFITYIGPAGFQSNIVAFNIDQLIGASGDALSATVYWHFLWTFVAPVGVLPVIYYSGMNKFSFIPLMFLTVCLSAGGVALVVGIVIGIIFHRFIDTTPHYYNPPKLIFQVLNYARKNKYPRNRSALTYWETNHPSRLDLGKNPYGGPFTVEEVEDVKSVLRLLPTLISIAVVPLAWDGNNLVAYFSDSFDSNLFQFSFQRGGFLFVMCGCLILLYQFVLHPFFSKYLPTMLNKIKVGLFFGLLSALGYIELLLWGDVTLHSSPFPIPLDCKWLLIPQTFCSIALFMVMISSFEFVVAQSPQSMRGLMVGLWYSSLGVGKTMDRVISLIFIQLLHIKNPGASCIPALCDEIFTSVVFTLTILIFFVISRNYKLRIRENIVPVMQIAEEHYDRYFKQSDEHRRLYGIDSSSESSFED